MREQISDRVLAIFWVIFFCFVKESDENKKILFLFIFSPFIFQNFVSHDISA